MQSSSRSSSVPTPIPTRRRGSPTMSSSRIPTSRSRSMKATSPSTRTSSGSSNTSSVTDALTLRDLAARHVDELKSVGPKLRTGLAEMGITTVLDLLDHYPRRYVDRTERAEIAELSIGDEATVDAEVRAVRSRR